jgi:hypothetical protein
MAPKYTKAGAKKIAKAMHERKAGTLRSGCAADDQSIGSGR